MSLPWQRKKPSSHLKVDWLHQIVAAANAVECSMRMERKMRLFERSSNSQQLSGLWSGVSAKCICNLFPRGRDLCAALTSWLIHKSPFSQQLRNKCHRNNIPMYITHFCKLALLMIIDFCKLQGVFWWECERKLYYKSVLYKVLWFNYE